MNKNIQIMEDSVFSTPLKNTVHVSKHLMTLLLALFSLMAFSNSQAAEKVTTRFCMDIHTKHGGSDSNSIFLNLHGSNRQQTGYVALNNSGKNDFVSGQRSCFNFDPWDLPSQRDVGFHTRAVVKMEQDLDDFCVTQMFSQRLVKRKGKDYQLSLSKFGNPNKLYCFGDYDSNSKTIRAFNSTNKPPKKKAKLTAGKLRAEWEMICSTKCQETSSYTITKGSTKEKVNSKETTNALSVSVSAGVEFPGASMSTEITTSTEKTLGQTFSRAISSENSLTKNDGAVYTLDEMSKYGIHAVWQWVAKSRLSNGEVVTVRTKKFTCTPTAAKPTYLPGSAEHVGTCTTEKDKPMSAIERAQLEKAQLEIAILKQKAGMTQQAPEPQYQQQEQPAQYNSADLEVTPVSSPIRIWMPSSWVKADIPSYDVFYTDPGQDAFVAFRIMDKANAESVINELNAGLQNMVANIQAGGAAEKFDINGMPTQLNRYVGTIDGGSVDLMVLYVEPPASNYSVYIVSVVGTSKAAEFEITLSDIIEGIEPN